MELVEGPTLAERIKGGAIPLEESLNVASQIADALEAAHEKGIIHRDLKPANIKLRPDGTVKVLDFGLAKCAETAAVGVQHREFAHGLLCDAATRAGVILGTAAYMTPEQARGEAVDKRADIWAFGVVLYEMLTGERLFEGETVSDTLVEVATKEPRVGAGSGEGAASAAPLSGERSRSGDCGTSAMRGSCWKIACYRRRAATARHSVRWRGIVAAVVTLALARACLRPFSRAAARCRADAVPDPAAGQHSSRLPLAAEEVSPDGRKLAFAAAGADGRDAPVDQIVRFP